MMVKKVSFLFACLISIFTISCGKKGEDCIYLIPKDYEGNVLIIFNQPKGLDTVYEGQARIYQIDTTGIFRTKFQVNYGLQRAYYYYVDSFGNRTDIKVALPSHLNGENQVVVVNPETWNYFDTVRKIQQHYELFSIAREYQMDSIANLRSAFMWKNVR